MNTPHHLARMSDPTPRGYTPRRPTQVPASNSTARKRQAEREMAAIWEQGAAIAQRSDREAEVIRWAK